MAKKRFSTQYNILGLKVPSPDMAPREKAELIFHAAAKILGLDPAALPVVHHLPEEFQVFPVVSFQLEVIRKALVSRRVADWNDRSEEKYGSWFLMNDPGFRFGDSRYGLTYSSGGSRLCTFSVDDQDFFAIECIALWADFCGGQLPAIKKAASTEEIEN
ncbi:MAG TPA: hypothetical protein VFE32_17195 [Puia sp.]|nr:hypothetical protein [Puia sp.]